MAHVTMTGIEYKDLVRKEDQLHELINYLCAQRKIRIPEHSVSTYSCGRWNSTMQMPLWLKDMYVTALLSQLILLPRDEFLNMVKADCHYYNVVDMSLTSCSWDDAVDLLDASPDFKRLWEEAKAELEGQKEEEAEDEE